MHNEITITYPIIVILSLVRISGKLTMQKHIYSYLPKSGICVQNLQKPKTLPIHRVFRMKL